MSNWSRLSAGSAFAALAIALASPAAVMAQETTATVSGDVVSAGSPVSGATVIITHVPSGTRAAARTDASGQFSASGLRAGGPYRIDVAAAGFRSTTVTDLFLVVGTPFLATIDLEASTAGVETVVVTASAVNRGRADGTVTGLRRDAIDGVSAPSRDLRELARRSPLATANIGGAGSDGGISIAGSNPRTNRITIDGVQAQDDFGLNTGGLPTRRGPISLDAISQFNITPTPFDVRNGGFLGGAIDVVLASGDNELEGSIFANFLDKRLTGSRIRNTRVTNEVEQTNWGATLRGPIIPDTLFYALSYETYSSIDTTARGPAGLGFANTILSPVDGVTTGMTQAEIDNVTNVFRNTYGSTYAFGSIPGSKPIEDEKYSIRLDWNISDAHRASFTYRRAESIVFNFTNLGTTNASLDSQWYYTGEQDETYSVQVNSDWSDVFQTEARVSYRDYTRLQEPPLGQNFANIQVCATPTALNTTGSDPNLSCANATGTGRPIVSWGPDQFRHANYLTTSNLQGQFEGRLSWGDHLIKGGMQVQSRDVYNLFVEQSDGVWYFDSIADFTAGRANRLFYRNHPSGDPTRAAAVFDYQIWAFYLQDTWQVQDNLRLSYGLRYEAYGMDGRPTLNQNFVTRHGFNNQTTYDGLDIVMPRVSFSWEPLDTITVSGGFGLFSGGLPDVFLSNSFSNNGIDIVGIDIRRVGTTDTFIDGTANPNFNPVTMGAPVMNGLVGANFGRSVPAVLNGALVPTPGEITNSIAPDFEVPSEWKVNVAVNAELPFGLTGGLDVVYTQVQTGYAFRDIRSVPLIVNGARALSPDGRLRYDALTTAQRTSVVGTTVSSTAPIGGSNRDLQLYNPTDSELGDAFIAAVSLSREWPDVGITASVSYTFQNINELANSGRFSSTASSLYGGQFSRLDPNGPSFGEGQEEIENTFKYSFEWRGDILGGLETRFNLFGDLRAGRPFTWVMGTGTGRSGTFGVNKGSQLAYIPDFSGTLSNNGTSWVLSSDPRVAFDSQATADSVRNLVTRFALPQGGIVPRSFNRNDDIHLVDAKLSQELPALRDGDRAFVTFEISNLLNMLNEDWGVIEEFGDTQTLFNVVCADTNGGATNAGMLLCNRYRISNPSNILTNAPSRNVERSRWQIQVGLRYEF